MQTLCGSKHFVDANNITTLPFLASNHDINIIILSNGSKLLKPIYLFIMIHRSEKAQIKGF